MANLVQTEKEHKGYVCFTVEGLRGLIYFPASIVKSVDGPVTLEGITFVEAGSNAPKVAKAKMSEEEKAAAKQAAAEARKNMTPADKAAAAKKRAEAAAARAAKLEAEAAKAAEQPTV